ncbi:MAG: hypothetical protein ACOCUL_04235 [Bacteroidota bacterium]
MNKKVKAYVYPITNRLKTGIFNPYVHDLASSLGTHFDVLNKNKPSNIGIINIFRYIPQVKFIFLNWPENLPDKKAGKLQALILMTLIPFFKLSGKKIVWTMHNKLSHSKKNIKLKKRLFITLLKNSDYIFTHSSEGQEYARRLTKKNANIIYLPHPVKKDNLGDESKITDILIWGTIATYKGIDQFLHYIYKYKMEDKYKINIVGKVQDKEYKNMLMQFANKNIIIEDRFVEIEELKKLISQSKIVLFTYTDKSVLSSGALMDSVGYGATVVGPHVAAFKDLQEDKVIYTYKDFDQLIPLLNRLLKSKKRFSNKKQVDKFLKENDWQHYSQKVKSLVEH